MFELKRHGANVPAEVQRWQYFLRTQGVVQVGPIDASFGVNTEKGTKIFQIDQGLSPHGRVDDKTLNAAAGLGYRILNDDYYEQRAGVGWPDEPADLQSPSNAWRNELFECFEFMQKNPRPDAEAIVIRGNCAGDIDDWEENFIINMRDDRFQFAAGYQGYIRCHVRAADKIKALLDVWERESLLHLVLNYAGCFVPRYKRGQAPSRTRGHGKRLSVETPKLSNHSFGSAFDISTTWNWLGDTPAVCGKKGSVRELVASANAAGVYWGGHFSSKKDGMHFELTQL